MENKLKIAIIDSGVDKAIAFDLNTFTGYSVNHYLNTYQVIEDDCPDEIGHGTAIIDILNKNLKYVSFNVYKIFDAVFETEEDRLIFTLNYILKNCSCNIIHISSGLIQSERYSELYSVCEKLYNQGSIIISAYDNNGSISYPAAFPFVIGVDLSDKQLSLTEYEYIENSIINIRASSAFHRLRWTNPATMLAQGTSFSSAYITLKIANILLLGFSNLDEVLESLKNNAKYLYSEPIYSQYNGSFVRNISKSIAFPFNKEIHSLAANLDCLDFEIIDFYDSKYSMNVGKSISEILTHVKNNKTIKDINDLLWNDDFDTIILGHCSALNAITKKDWTQFLINKAMSHNKKVFSLDKIFIPNTDLDNNPNIYYPNVNLDMVPKCRFGKLRSIDKPILGILGTNSQQGKFSLQLKLKKMFINAGYKIAQIGTEPQSPLFGIDRVFPIGFNSTVSIHGIQSITLLNEYLWDISQNDVDIILIGSQSGTVPYTFNHLSQFPIYQNDFLLGTQPDYIVLCVNPHDPIDYISRSIKYVEGLIDTRIIALMMFPIIQEATDIGNRYKKRKLDTIETNNIINQFKTSLKLNVYLLNDENHLNELFNQILQVFSVDE